MAFGYQVLGFGSAPAAAAAVEFNWGGGRGIAAGGLDPSQTNRMQYITIASLGNATDFGDLVQNQGEAGALSNGSRCVVGGGTS